MLQHSIVNRAAAIHFLSFLKEVRTPQFYLQMVSKFY